MCASGHCITERPKAILKPDWQLISSHSPLNTKKTQCSVLKVQGKIFFLHDPMHPNEVSSFLSPRALYCQHQLWEHWGVEGLVTIAKQEQNPCTQTAPIVSTDQWTDFQNSSHGLKSQVNLSLSLMCCCMSSHVFLGWYPWSQTTVSLKSWWDHFSHNYLFWYLRFCCWHVWSFTCTDLQACLNRMCLLMFCYDTTCSC